MIYIGDLRVIKKKNLIVPADRISIKIEVMYAMLLCMYLYRNSHVQPRTVHGLGENFLL